MEVLIQLVLSCVVLLAYELRNYKETAVRNLSTVAGLIAANSTAILVFDGQAVAQEVLSGLAAEPEVLAAA
ncbi:MAG: hypothetical protein FJ403_18390 [Verrucomicrobia bacterium]|nr:hypothetical protein [Verrucomicrobiota bacterium]